MYVVRHIIERWGNTRVPPPLPSHDQWSSLTQIWFSIGHLLSRIRLAMQYYFLWQHKSKLLWSTCITCILHSSIHQTLVAIVGQFITWTLFCEKHVHVCYMLYVHVYLIIYIIYIFHYSHVCNYVWRCVWVSVYCVM